MELITQISSTGSTRPTEESLSKTASLTGLRMLNWVRSLERKTMIRVAVIIGVAAAGMGRVEFSMGI